MNELGQGIRTLYAGRGAAHPRSVPRRAWSDAESTPVATIREFAGVTVWAVDALDDQAAAFYERYGFVRWPVDGLRLFLRIKDLGKTFEIA